MQIRKYQSEDCDAIFSLIQNELGYHDLNIHEFKNRMIKIEQHPDCTTFVAEQDNEIIGFIGIQKLFLFECDETIKINALAIKEKAQHQGCGTLLMNYVFDFAKHENVHHFVVSSSMHRLSAHQFYEKLGFYKKSYTFIK